MSTECKCVYVLTAHHSVPQPGLKRFSNLFQLTVQHCLYHIPLNRLPFFPQSTLSLCSTLKPDSNAHRLLNPPHPSRSFPFTTLFHRNKADQHLITATPHPRIEAHWLYNKALPRPKYFTPESVSHLVLLVNVWGHWKVGMCLDIRSVRLSTGT